MSYMRSEARAAQILACAKKVFAERGFHNANISHICEAAGIGRGTLYQYFTNKRSVLTAILRETLDRARAVMQRQSTEAKYPAPETLTRSAVVAFSARQLRALLDVIFRDEDTLRIVLREAVGLDVDVEKILGEIDETAIAILERDLVRARDAGILRDLDARAAAIIVVGGIEKLALKALRGEVPLDLDKLAMEAALLHTVGTLSDRVQTSLPRNEEEA